MKKLLTLVTLFAISAGLYACGGGSGGNLGGNEGTSSGERVATKVEASLVKGATVCVEDTNNCNQTDDNGTAILKVSKLPVTLVVKIGDLTLGSVNANSTYTPITPLDLANGDNQTAEKLGALIHAIAGDTTGNSSKIDLSKKKIILKENVKQPLVELLKESNSVDLTVEDNNGNHTVVVDNGTVQVDNETVNYNKNLQKLKDNEEKAKEFVKFLKKYDGKLVIFNDPEDNGTTCVLNFNPENPLQFMFTNCSNPEDNDSSWENIIANETGTKVIDEDGRKSTITKIDVKNGKVEYQEEDDNGTLINGQMIVQEEGKQLLLRALEGKFDSVYQVLKNKSRKTDEEKIAYAIALLGRSAQLGPIKHAGFEVIPSYKHTFVVDGALNGEGKRWCNSTQWVGDAKSLIEAINNSLRELNSVSKDINIEIPASYLEDDNSTILDGVSVDALKAILTLTKAKLEYLLAYDWKDVAELCQNGTDNETLPYLERIELSDQSYIEKSRNDLDTALKELEKIATQEVPNMPDNNYSKSLLTWALTDDEGNYPDKEEIENLGTNTISKLVDSLETGETEVSNINGTHTYTINLKYIFNNPIDGTKIKDDADSGKIIEKKVCDEGWEECYANETCEKHCTDIDVEIWFTDNSYIYNYITSISPNATLYERTLNGTTYYTIDENEYWNWDIGK
jgi:hypothetical protein